MLGDTRERERERERKIIEESLLTISSWTENFHSALKKIESPQKKAEIIFF